MTSAGDRPTEVVGGGETRDDRPAGRQTVVDGGTTVEVHEGDTAPGAPLPASPRPGFPVPGWSRYEPMGFLGEGGMGRVWEARDLTLGRRVALKFLRGDDPDLAARLLNEARAQSRVDHPNVCRVYEAGEVEGRAYVAMQRIDGLPLNQAAPTMRLEEKVRVIAEVAEGIQAAHRQGLVHRDIKPGNVMVEREEGGWHPYVLDFGVARDLAGPARTSTGMIVGTPWYMAPEQARGDSKAIDRRTDVYALGATLREVLVGSPPFGDSTGIDVLLRVLEEEPEPPRKVDRSIPEDLDVVVSTCLEKDPAHRYDSARALAEDLRRWLAGEPVRARPIGRLERLRRLTRRHRLAVAVAAGALLAVGAAGAWALRSNLRARQQTLLATRFGREAEQMEGLVRLGAMAPLHDLSEERREVRRRVRALEAEVAGAGRLAAAPGAFALGRAHLVLGEHERARALLSLAWDLGWREPDVAWALGRAYGLAYEQELAAVERAGGRDAESARREAERRWRDPALLWIGRARGQTSLDSPEWVEALLAFYERSWERALDRAAEAERGNPWRRRDTRRLVGQVRLAQANERRLAGDLGPAGELFDAAESAFAEAADQARSDPDTRLGLCETLGLRIYLDVDGGNSPEATWRRAEEACRTAVQVDPGSARGWNALANAAKRWAAWADAHGGDPLAALRTSAEAARRALSLDPRDTYARLNLGVVERLRAEREMRLGFDASERLDQAIRAFEEVVSLDPRFAHGWNNLGLTLRDRARAVQGQGGDPGPDTARAAEAFSRATGVDPRFAAAWQNLGDARLDQAQAAESSGADPGPLLDQAEDAYRRALEVNPGHAAARHGLQTAGARRGRRGR